MIRRLAALLALVVVGVLGALWVVQTEPGWYVRMRYPIRYESIVRAHARNYHLDPALLAAVIYTESKFDPSVRSKAGAIGLMQLLPGTAQGIADRTGGHKYTEQDLLNPEINIRYGAWYLDHLRQKYSGRPNGLDLALAAYNAGQGAVDSWIARTPPGQAVEIPYPETRAYVAKVRRMQRLYQKAYGL